MLGRSTPELILIRTCIFGFKAIAPLSVIYTLLRVLGLPAEYVLPLPLEVWVFAEAAFYAVVYYPNKYLSQRAALHPPLLPRPEREKLVERCFALLPDGTTFLSGWFHQAPVSTIKRENVREYVCWAFLGGIAKPQSHEQEEEVEGYVCRLQQRLGITFESGWNPKVRSLRLTLDPVPMEHRPLVWYGVVSLLDVYSSIRLWHAGFQHRSMARWFRVLPPRPQTTFTRRSPATHLSYWVRPHTSRTKLPIVFLHGIGIGVYPYVDFLRDVVKTAGADVGIIFVEVLPVSARICHPPLSREEFCRQMSQVLDAHSIDKFTLVAHSYGTILATHLLHSFISPRISSLILVDAVPFLLHHPPVAYNFVHKVPSTANEFQLRFFASRDAGIAHTLSRHFFWAQNILWKEELEGRRVAVVLSGRDLIVDSLACWKYLTGLEEVERDVWCSPDGQLTVLWNAELDHSQVFDSRRSRLPVVGLVEEFVGGE